MCVVVSLSRCGGGRTRISFVGKPKGLPERERRKGTTHPDTPSTHPDMPSTHEHTPTTTTILREAGQEGPNKEAGHQESSPSTPAAAPPPPPLPSLGGGWMPPVRRGRTSISFTCSPSPSACGSPVSGSPAAQARIESGPKAYFVKSEVQGQVYLHDAGRAVALATGHAEHALAPSSATAAITSCVTAPATICVTPGDTGGGTAEGTPRSKVDDIAGSSGSRSTPTTPTTGTARGASNTGALHKKMPFCAWSAMAARGISQLARSTAPSSPPPVYSGCVDGAEAIRQVIW